MSKPKARASSRHPNGGERVGANIDEGIGRFGFFRLDRLGRVIDWNPGAERLFGYSALEISGRPFSLLFSLDDQKRGEPERTLRVAAETGSFVSEGWQVRRDGCQIWCLSITDSVRDDHGEIVGFQRVARLLIEKAAIQTAADQSRDRLARSDDMPAVEPLIYGMSSDAENILAVIRINIENLRKLLRSASSQAEIGRLMDDTARYCQRAANLTARVIRICDVAPSHLAICELKPVFAGALGLPRDGAGKGNRIEVICPDRLLVAVVDPSGLMDVVRLIADGLVRAIPGKAKFSVRAENVFLDTDYCRLRPEVLPGPYVRIAMRAAAPGAGDRVGEPIGGMDSGSIVSPVDAGRIYGFVKRCRRDIEAFGVLGRSITVSLYLPAPEAANGDRAEASEVAIRLINETILLVEDDDEVRAHLAIELRRTNYRVLVAGSAAAALDLIDTESVRPDLLLTEAMLQGVDGYQLAKDVRRRHPGSVALFMAPAGPSDVLRNGCLDAGFGVVQKPVSLSVLLESIRTLLDAAESFSAGQTE